MLVGSLTAMATRHEVPPPSTAAKIWRDPNKGHSEHTPGQTKRQPLHSTVWRRAWGEGGSTTGFFFLPTGPGSRNRPTASSTAPPVNHISQRAGKNTSQFHPRNLRKRR